jgi:hypothetical protein
MEWWNKNIINKKKLITEKEIKDVKKKQLIKKINKITPKYK